MIHEWHAVVAEADARPGGWTAELVEGAIWRAHGPDVPVRGGGRQKRSWADILDAVMASRVPAHELRDAYLLHYVGLGGVRPSVGGTDCSPQENDAVSRSVS